MILLFTVIGKGRDGGTGRRAWLRTTFLWSGGSSPLPGTITLEHLPAKNIHYVYNEPIEIYGIVYPWKVTRQML